MGVVRPGTRGKCNSAGLECLVDMVKRLALLRGQIKDVGIGEAADFLESRLKWFQVGHNRVRDAFGFVFAAPG